jgi:hypothetical protein
MSDIHNSNINYPALTPLPGSTVWLDDQAQLRIYSPCNHLPNAQAVVILLACISAHPLYGS